MWIRSASVGFAVALGIVACSKKSEGPSAPTCPTCVTVGEQGFVPSTLTLKKGAPGSKATITFTRTTEDTCATAVVFPDLNVKQDLPLNKQTPVEVPTDAARTLAFQCGMGMYKSKVVVQ